MVIESENKTPDTIESNPVGLPTLACKEIVDELDKLVAAFSVQFHQYEKRHWLVKGPEHRDLHLFYEKLYSETQSDLDAIAERITLIGGIPTSSMRGLSERSFLEEEAEGERPLRDMMACDLENEGAIAVRIRSVIKLTQDLTDYGTETLLKQTLQRVEHRAHDLDHYLSQDTLVRADFAHEPAMT